MENREALIQSKIEEIQSLLEWWAKRYDVLELGEMIEFTMAIKKVPLVVHQPGLLRDWLDNPVADLNLGIRARKVCIRAGVATIRDLTTKSAIDLSKIRTCGTITLNEIREKLVKNSGLKLREE